MATDLSHAGSDTVLGDRYYSKRITIVNDHIFGTILDRDPETGDCLVELDENLGKRHCKAAEMLLIPKRATGCPYCSIAENDDSSNPMLLCDGCDVEIHATCRPGHETEKIPQGKWFCTLCVRDFNLGVDSQTEVFCAYSQEFSKQ